MEIQAEPHVIVLITFKGSWLKKIVPLPRPRGPLEPRAREPLAPGQFLIQCPERPHP